jgi:DNA invertase Pin-like site-specific DNA recombinase
MHLAYSHLRFSSPQQATGDSIRRQTENRESWLAAHPRVRLDTSLVMTDAGRSAFRRKNRDTYALARFVDHIKLGRVEPGSYLLVENLDRLSREDAGEAVQLFLTIVNAGVIVVQLSPAVMEFKRPVEAFALMFAIMELSRGHSESRLKSERCGSAWSKKQAAAASKVVTRKLPGWVKCVDGRLVIDPARAETVRRLFALARDGHGAETIAARLNAEGVPILGRKAMKGDPITWAGTTVRYILHSRATIGEYVPYKHGGRRGQAAGEPVANYFPAVIDLDTFHAVQAAIATRKKIRGRRGRYVNLFAGLLVDARGGGRMTYWQGGRPASIVPSKAREGRGGRWIGFPAAVFESTILSQLGELKAADVTGDGSPAKRVESLRGRLGELDDLARAWEARMEDLPIVETVARKLAEIGAKRRAIAAELDEAVREAASPLSEAWGELRSLADLLGSDGSDDLRVKVRAALRRAVASVHCLFVPRGRTRIAAVRVQFAGSDRHRDYAILYTPTAANAASTRPAVVRVRSLPFPGHTRELDLREAADVARLERALLAWKPTDKKR